MKLRTVIYSLLLATLCMGCDGRISMRQLEQLEARVNDAPDSVLTVLTATDMPRWGERRALYALLTVQAQDKSYIDVADDSLIRVATRYYDRNGLPLRRLQAFYYHGRVYANAGLNHEAMTAYTRAEEFVEEVDVPLLIEGGGIYESMGYACLYLQNGTFPSSSTTYHAENAYIGSNGGNVVVENSGELVIDSDIRTVVYGGLHCKKGGKLVIK